MAVMKRKSVKELLSEIYELEQRRRQALEELLETGPLLSGSLSEVKHKCGKPGCYCAKGEDGHLQLQVVFTEAGRQRCRTIRKGDAEKVKRWAKSAKRFRAGLAQLKAMANEQMVLLDGLKRVKSKIYDP